MSSRTETKRTSVKPRAPRSTAGNIGIFRKLEAEHAEVERLMQHLAADTGAERRNKLFPKIRRELLSHGRAKQKEVYPVLKRYESTRALATDAIAGYGEIEGLVEELDDREMPDDRFDQTFRELRAVVQDHIRSEESELFPKAKEVVSQDLARDLEFRFARQREEELDALD